MIPRQPVMVDSVFFASGQTRGSLCQRSVSNVKYRNAGSRRDGFARINVMMEKSVARVIHQMMDTRAALRE
jgi:hypothetical protein